MLLYEKKCINRQIPLLLLICLCCFAPFLNKAFHIDDPTFIGIAKHIQSHPLDYFGYYLQFSPPVITNPPLVAYFIAIAGYFFGYSEIAIHAAFMLPASIVVIGTYLLAADMSENPFMAALAVICMPVFLLSGTTVMCDVLMLSFWVFSVYFWRRGIKEDRRLLLFISSLLIILCVMTKYMGICLIPLLLAYSLSARKKAGEWLLYLALPLAALLLFDQITYMIYGLRQIHFIESWSSYNQTSSGRNLYTNLVTGLSFLGGCILVHFIFFVSKIKKILFIGHLLVVATLLLLLLNTDILNRYPIATSDGINWLFLTQLLFFVVAGTSFLHILIVDFARSRDSDSLLLLLWIVGVLAFTVAVNWTVNGRTILPMVPAAGIVVARFMERTSKTSFWWGRALMYVSLGFSLTVSFMVTNADMSLANSARTAAQTIYEATKTYSGNKWYEGHWGFEHYLGDAGGFRSLDYEKPNLKKGDIVIIPSNNTHTKPLFKHLATVRNIYTFEMTNLFSTMNVGTGAGFYADVAGPLPFALGSLPEKYYQYEIITDKQTRFIY
jgi:4-amino-4-deoxy-L-arabinose transferase-like glycosyltransferase